MLDNSKDNIIQAIKNFNITSLKELLDDNKPYQDVSKALFIDKLEKKFNQAKRNDCHFFDDVFFGICESCNKGCEGMTFLSNSGYYLDLFIESKDDINADDIYVCNKLTNFTDLDKTMDLGFSFNKDEELLFEPSTEYSLIENEYNLLKAEISLFTETLKLKDLQLWYYDNFDFLSKRINGFGPFECFAYSLYSNAYNLISQVERVFELLEATQEASESLIDYQTCATEKEKVIWFFQNQKNLYGSIHYELSENWNKNSIIIYKQNKVNLILDISGYEYVLDYFLKIDKLHKDLIEKYKPLLEHFGVSETGSVEYSLENYLRLHNKYLDVVEKYGRKGY